MGKAKFEIWYLDDVGNRLSPINDVGSFEYVKVLGGEGVGIIDIPKRGQVYDNNTPDRRIAFYRQNGRLSLDAVVLARRFETKTSQHGQNRRKMTGYDFNELLRRRIIAYYAAESETDMTDNADDMMKEIVRDNFIDNADYSGTPSPARDIDDYGFSVQSDSGAGPSLTKSFAWRNVLETLQDLQAASRTAGTETFFGIVPTSDTTMQFRTWTAGVDRTITTGTNPIVFSLEWGNLASPSLVYDYSTDENYIYAGGQGEDDARNVQTAGDADRYDVSRLGRREAFANAGHIPFTDDDGVTGVAQDRLTKSRNRITFTGTIYDTPLTPYGGIHGWNLGDKVTINYSDLQFDVIIRAVHVKVNERGHETVSARVEIDE